MRRCFISPWGQADEVHKAAIFFSGRTDPIVINDPFI